MPAHRLFIKPAGTIRIAVAAPENLLKPGFPEHQVTLKAFRARQPLGLFPKNIGTLRIIGAADKLSVSAAFHRHGGTAYGTRGIRNHLFNPNPVYPGHRLHITTGRISGASRHLAPAGAIEAQRRTALRTVPEIVLGFIKSDSFRFLGSGVSGYGGSSFRELLWIIPECLSIRQFFRLRRFGYFPGGRTPGLRSVGSRAIRNCFLYYLSLFSGASPS